MTIVGRTYFERGRPVDVIAQWRQGASGQAVRHQGLDVATVVRDGEAWRAVTLKGAPRNVMIRRAGGELVIRPFRGLRRSRAGADPAGRAPPTPLK
jgi:hypothetical protein